MYLHAFCILCSLHKQYSASHNIIVSLLLLVNNNKSVSSTHWIFAYLPCLLTMPGRLLLVTVMHKNNISQDYLLWTLLQQQHGRVIWQECRYVRHHHHYKTWHSTPLELGSSGQHCMYYLIPVKSNTIRPTNSSSLSLRIIYNSV